MLTLDLIQYTMLSQCCCWHLGYCHLVFGIILHYARCFHALQDIRHPQTHSCMLIEAPNHMSVLKNVPTFSR